MTPAAPPRPAPRAPNAAPSPPEVKPDKVLGAWLLGLLLLLVVTGGFYVVSALHQGPPPPPLPVGGERARWFLTVRLPAVTAQRESGVETMKKRYAEWLAALTRAGYHAATFSDVQRALATGESLPEKSLVMLFDPGFRRTLNVISPLFRAAGWRAVWLSDDAAMRARHREYITYHQARQMSRARWWDVGLKEDDGTYFFPEAGRAKAFSLGDAGHPAWVPTKGGRAVNRLAALSNFTRLNVIADWTAADLVNRLDAEIPIEEPSFLTVAPVQHLLWGTSRKRRQGGDSRFNLDALPERTGHLISWFGTEGLNDGQVTATGQELVGSLALRFRWDDQRGDGVQVVIEAEAVTVQERRASQGHTLLRVPRSAGAAFAVTASVRGTALVLSLEGQEPKTVALQSAGTGHGFFQIYLFDRIRDVARVRGLSVMFDPS